VIVGTDCNLTISRPTHVSRVHPIQHKHHSRAKLESLFIFFPRSCDIISNLNDDSILFPWRSWFGYPLQIDQSPIMHSANQWQTFFWRGQNTTLTTTTECIFFDSKICKVSSVVGAPSGRHSRLDPALSTFHVLQLYNSFISRSTTGLP
jgi:hypothetical protein